MITDFPLNPLANMAGLQAFSFTPYQYIDTIPPSINKLVTSDVTFLNDNQFLIGYSTIGELEFTEKFVDDDNGGVYNWLITGFTPGDDDVLVELLEEMKYSRYLVLTNDYNQVLRLVGSNAPLTFSADYDSGKTEADQKGYTFTFTGQSRLRAPRYDPRGKLF